MKGVSFFALITGVILLGGYVFYNKKSPVQEKVITQTEVVQPQEEPQKEVVETVKEIQPVLTDSILITQIQTLIKDIRAISMGNYGNLKKEYFNYNFGTFDWDIGSINGDQFFIELRNVDKVKCNKLMDAILDAITVKVNSSIKKDCDNLNNIQFIFN